MLARQPQGGAGARAGSPLNDSDLPTLPDLLSGDRVREDCLSSADIAVRYMLSCGDDPGLLDLLAGRETVSPDRAVSSGLPPGEPGCSTLSRVGGAVAAGVSALASVAPLARGLAVSKALRGSLAADDRASLDVCGEIRVAPWRGPPSGASLLRGTASGSDPTPGPGEVSPPLASLSLLSEPLETLAVLAAE